MTKRSAPLRTGLFDDPENKFIHNVVLDSCRKHGDKLAIVDTSCAPPRRVTYAEYGDLVERTARGLVAAGIRPGEMIGIYLPNCWGFGGAFHAASEAVALISDGPLLEGISLAGLPALRNVYTTRTAGSGGTQVFGSLYSANA